MADQNFIPTVTAALTSTTSSQTIAIPAGCTTLILYNGATNPVYLRFGASIALPTAGAGGVYLAPPGQTVSYACQLAGGTLAYIADTAGGALAISAGVGS